MRTFINTRCLLAPQTGVQRYTRGLLQALGSDVEPLQPSRQFSGAFNHFWEQSVLPVRARGGVLISPGNTGPLAHARQILTLHDASVFDHPEWFRPAFARWYRLVMRMLAKRAAIVVTDSEFSRRRLAHALDLPESGLQVVPVGVSPHFRPRSSAEVLQVTGRLQLTKPYLLYVGSLEPRKNLRTLIAAWRFLAAETNGLELVLVGVRGRVFRESGLEGEGASGVRMLGHLPDEDLPALYTGAQGVVYPSLYEGFGLPVLEAMACGVPVAASRIDVLREITCDRLLSFNPQDPHELADQLRKLRDMASGERQRISDWSLARAAEYPWSRTAGDFRALIRQLGSGPATT